MKDSHKKVQSRSVDGLYYLLAFCVSVAGMLLILKSRGFYPFKEETLFVLDMQDQMMEFYASLRYAWNSDNSIFYTWNRSLGGNYLGLYAYYLANPLSWITVLFPVEKIYQGILVLTLLKTGCCGLTFSVFASYLWKRYFSGHTQAPEADRSRWYRFLLIPVAVSYALISYNIIYSSCLMWLDGVILLPLVLLGIEKILEGEKGLFYLIAFAAACLFNYYTGYMTGIFAALYFLFRVFAEFSRKAWKNYLFAALRLAAVTLLSVLLSAPLLLPAVLDLSSGKMVTPQVFAEKYINFPFFSLFEKFTNGSYHGLIPVHGHSANMPNVYCGYAALALAVIFFLLRKISLREKLAAGALLIVLVCSFYFVPLNLIWHGFVYPNGFPCRYSFVMSFFLLYLAVRTLCALPVGKLPSIWQRKPVFEGIAVIFMGIVALDMGINGRTLFYEIQNEFGYTDVGDYKEFLASTQPLLEEIQKEDEGIYRINQGYEYSKNDAMLLGYNGLTHYSSTFNAAVNSLILRLGMAQDYIYSMGYGSTPLTDSLLGVKYILRDSGTPDFYTRMGETEYGMVSYKNENALPVVYGAPLSGGDVKLEEDSPFRNQNALLNGIAGTDAEYFTPVTYSEEGDENGWFYKFTADSEDPVYLYMHFAGYSYAEIYVNGEQAGEYFTSETKCILYLGSFEPGQQVEVEVRPSRATAVESTEIFRLQEALLCDTLQALQAGNMRIDSHGGGTLEGAVSVPEGGKIITSIPYDKGWSVKIDGKKVPIQKFADTFIMVDAESGEHAVAFSYVSPGIGAGLLSFAAGLLLSILYFRKCRPKTRS